MKSKTVRAYHMKLHQHSAPWQGGSTRHSAAWVLFVVPILDDVVGVIENDENILQNVQTKSAPHVQTRSRSPLSWSLQHSSLPLFSLRSLLDLKCLQAFPFKIGLAFMYYEVIRRAFRLIDLATKSNKFIDVYRLHFSKKYGVAASS